MSLATLVLREAPEEPFGTRPTPAQDPDHIEQLGDEIATLAAHIHAATHRMLVMIAEFDRLRGWEQGGHRSCAHWLSFRTGIDLGAAREKVRAARGLTDTPLISEAMSKGELSFSQVRALTRVADASNESDLLALAHGATTAQLERMVRAWRKGTRQDEAAWERERHESRKLSVFPDDEGMYVVTGRLPGEVGQLLMRAIEAAGDALFKEKPAPWLREDTERKAAQRRADAMGLLAERALAAGFGDGASACEGCEAEPRDTGSAADGGEGAVADAAPPEPPISGTSAERYLVMLHVEPSTLSAGGEPGRSDFEDGTRVSPETSRRLTCDASMVEIVHAQSGESRSGDRDSILSVGRKTRTIPPALRRALEARDRGCRFPGCGLRFCDAHHVVHWADGGETSLTNCLLMCKFHHRFLHEGGWRVEWWGAGRPAFVAPNGDLQLDNRGTPPELPEHPVEALVRHNRDCGADPDPWTAGATWKHERDIPGDVFLRATEVW